MAVTDGLVLAGGKAARMNGVDKGLIDFRGRPLAAYAGEALRPHVARLWVSCNRHPEQYAAMADEVVADDMPDYPGPLAGIAAVLARCQADYLLVLPCDTPFFGASGVALLHEAIVAGGAAVAAVSDDGLQPLHLALSAPQAKESLGLYLQQGRRSVHGWLEAMGAGTVSVPAERLLNLNTLADLQAVRQSPQ